MWNIESCRTIYKIVINIERKAETVYDNYDFFF